jgi:hypothetical protein
MSSLLADRAVLPAEMAARVSQLEADFAVQFGQRPQLLVRVPGRVNLIGKQGIYENFKAGGRNGTKKIPTLKDLGCTVCVWKLNAHYCTY